jgi:hypothetical protein
VAVAVAEELAIVGGRQLYPKKQKSAKDSGEMGSSAGQAQSKRAWVELPNNI